MARKPDLDRILSARISGTASRYADTGTITPEREAEAVAALAALADGRRDLLAEHAGILLGTTDGEPEPLAMQRRLAARLCILAGADESLIPQWREIGRERSAYARTVPYTGVSSDHQNPD